jgi:hypothetical protein
MRMRFALLSALLALTAAPAALAHHSMAMFDLKTKKELTGTVREFQWTNPHCYVQLVVRNAEGKDEEWSLEMAAPAYLQAKGWKARIIKPGDRISVSIWPLRSGARGGMLDFAKTADGKPIGRHS